MLYAVDGVALGGWQLVDLGLMALVAIELLSLIFLKVVIILLGALLYATGPITIGLVATESGAAIARAWASAVVMLLALPGRVGDAVRGRRAARRRRRHGGPADRRHRVLSARSWAGCCSRSPAPRRCGCAFGSRARRWVCCGCNSADCSRSATAARGAEPTVRRSAVELGELAAPFQRQRGPGGRRRRRPARGRRPGWRDGGARRPRGRLRGAPRRARDRRSGGPSAQRRSLRPRSSARRPLARRRRRRSHGESRNRQLARRTRRATPPAQTCRRASRAPRPASGTVAARSRQPATSSTRPAPRAPSAPPSTAASRREDSQATKRPSPVGDPPGRPQARDRAPGIHTGRASRVTGQRRPRAGPRRPPRGGNRPGRGKR